MRIALASVLSLIVAATQQQSVPRFKSGVDVVQFTVTVLDKERHPVTGLTASDFAVLVDGQPRPLAAFAAVTLPDERSLASASVGSVAPDVQNNRLAPEGRLVVIVMDRSTPIGQPMQAARAIANAAIDRLGPNDLGAVVFTDVSSRKDSQGLTSDRARLHAAVAKALMGADTSRRVQLASEEQSGECICGVCVPEALTGIVKALTAGTVRHKSILFVGSDIAMATRFPGSTCESRIHTARERLSRALDEANVTFNVVDPRGLEALGESAENGGPVGNVDRVANILREQSLAVLPDDTGGRVVLNNNKPEAVIGAIFDESRAYYVLAVARDAAPRSGGDRHQVKISVDRAGATVRARRLFFAGGAAADPKPAGAAAAALSELLPRADFPLEMNLALQFSRDGSPEVHVLLGVPSNLAGTLDVLVGAFDPTLKAAAEMVKQRLEVPADAVAGSAEFQWSSTVKVPPGHYEVRAAVATAGGARAASVIGYVDVPELRKQGIALSGIIVKSGGTPTLRRDFPAGAALGLSFQVAHAKSEASNTTVRYALRDEAGEALATVDVPHERALKAAGGIDGYDIGVRLPAAAGRYVVSIDASDGKRSARRDVLLTVR